MPIDGEWLTLLRRVFDKPYASESDLHETYLQRCEKYGNWEMSYYVAEEAYRMGMYRASLALAYGGQNGVCELV